MEEEKEKGKTIFSFINYYDNSDIVLCSNRWEFYKMLDKLSEYIRTLKKYEERKEIPTEEVIEVLCDTIDNFYYIQELMEWLNYGLYNFKSEKSCFR